MPYKDSHPWISFAFDFGEFEGHTWRLLGEASASCDHLAGAPLDPTVAEELNRVFLAKGAFATTSIEGNTLTEEEVRQRLEGELQLPPSLDYLGVEIDNIVGAYNIIIRDLAEAYSHTIPFTPERLIGYDKAVLQNLEDHLEEGVNPGEYREGSVSVGSYLAPPREDVEELVGRLCEWLNTAFDSEQFPDYYLYPLAVVKAILAHLYLVWIHPFGDGNGRTARLMEFQILLEAGVPLPASHLFSDHYNRTRTDYYRQLILTSRVEPYSTISFLNYALQGFVDGLGEQLTQVRHYQMEVAWENFIHAQFRDKPNTPTQERRRHLVLDMPTDGTTIPRSGIRNLSSRVSDAYVGKQTKTITRDLNALIEMGLIRREFGLGYTTQFTRLAAFLPYRFDTD